MIRGCTVVAMVLVFHNAHFHNVSFLPGNPQLGSKIVFAGGIGVGEGCRAERKLCHLLQTQCHMSWLWSKICKKEAVTVPYLRLKSTQICS